MSRIRRFLGADKGSTFHSIYKTPPTTESNKEKKESKSKKKRSSSVYRIPQDEEEDNSTTSASITSTLTSETSQRTKTETDSIIELPSPDCERKITISELGEPDVIISELATRGQEVSELDSGVGVDLSHKDGIGDEYRGKRNDDGDGDGEDTECESHTSVNETKKTDADDLLIFSDADLDTTDAIPLFGRQFGIAPTSIIREQKQKLKQIEAEKEKEAEARKMKGPEAFFQQVDDELEALYVDYLKASGKGKQVSQGHGSKDVTTSKSKSKAKPDVCIICLETFLDVKAPDRVSRACAHQVSVCCNCLAKSIKHDLETKFWDEIKCPECKTSLIHQDIERFADAETFARYNRLSFRQAVSADKNFIWCLNCDFGQLHETGPEEPMVCCLNCSVVSCFKHSVKWHDEFTCDEYDAILWDPDSYKEIKAKNANSTASTRPCIPKTVLEKRKGVEQARQTKLHEAQKEAARLAQEKVAEQVRVEENEVAQQEEQEPETTSQDNKDDFREKLEMLKRRMREVELYQMPFSVLLDMHGRLHGDSATGELNASTKLQIPYR
ncbi:hypothetical protein BJX99DRAFT_263559 [Aspergillus californicus]